MGQRTAIILQHVNKYAAKYDKKNENNTRVFYHQWGIGRILPSQLLAILNGTISAGSYRTNFAECMKPQGCIDITEDYDESDRRKMAAITFDTPKKAGEIIKGADNNNGGIFIRITTNEDGDTEAIEYAYMLGYEEGGKYTKFCTAEEWMNKTGFEYIDNGFKAYYYQVLTYFKAEERANGEAKANDQNEKEAA